MEADLRKPWSFHRSTPSYELEETDPFTQTGPSHIHSGPVDTDTNREQSDNYRQVGQGKLHTTSERDLFLKPIQVDPELTQPEVGIRTQQFYPTSHTSGTMKRVILAGTGPNWEQPCFGDSPCTVFHT